MQSQAYSSVSNVLIIAPNCDGTDVGEAWRAFKWCESLSKLLPITVLTYQRPGRVPVSQQLPDAEVVTWPEPEYLSERFRAMAKPGYGFYYHNVRKWIQSQLAKGRVFDIAHQITPAALRYPSPLVGLGIPYILGPHGGSLTTPEPFVSECQSAAWYTRLRVIDQWRLCYDPIIKRSFREAEAVIGVGEYVRELLEPCGIKQFILHSELAADDLAPTKRFKSQANQELRLLHVGRVVRTKGLRDVIRALSHLKDLPGVTLDVAGDGEDLAQCKSEAKNLGVIDRINFHGHIPRDEVEKLYEKADVFVFPSFREPSGRVISEAFRWGLPIIAANRGGPGSVIDSTCGFKLPVENPTQLAFDTAQLVRQIIERPFLLTPMRIGARKKLQEEGLWPNKAEWLSGIYASILQQQQLKQEVAL